MNLKLAARQRRAVPKVLEFEHSNLVASEWARTRYAFVRRRYGVVRHRYANARARTPPEHVSIAPIVSAAGASAATSGDAAYRRTPAIDTP